MRWLGLGKHGPIWLRLNGMREVAALVDAPTQNRAVHCSVEPRFGGASVGAPTSHRDKLDLQRHLP
jgi:hypothetical protein